MEIAFFKTTLTQAQVLQIYNNHQVYNLKNSILSSEVLGYWRLGPELDYSEGSPIAPGLEILPTIGSNSMTTLDGVTLQTSIILEKLKNNNFYVQTNLPQSDYNYSWVDSALGDNYNVRSGTQKVFGYWPKNGMLSSSSGFDSAITFPTASTIQGS